MNAKLNVDGVTFDNVLRELYKLTRNVNKLKVQTFIPTFVGEDLNDFKGEIKTLQFLKDTKVIRDYKNNSRFEDLYAPDPQSGLDIPEMYCYYEPECQIKPQELFEYLVKISRLPKFYLRFSDDRKLILNDEYLLARTQFSSPNYYFMAYAIKHSGEIITKEKIKTAGGGLITKRFHTILEQLKFNSELKKIFFPNVSNDAAEFRNNLKIKDLKKIKINENGLNKYLKTLQKYKNKKS